MAVKVVCEPATEPCTLLSPLAAQRSAVERGALSDEGIIQLRKCARTGGTVWGQMS